MIIKPGIQYASVLSDIGKETFIQSHQNSAPHYEIETYTKKVYSLAAIRDELSDPANIYHLIQYENRIAGFSKMMLSRKHPAVNLQNTTKLDQLYLLESFHGLKLGAQLLKHNIELSKANNQFGMWLLVWIGNREAISFYNKFGFEIIGEEDFRLTDSHNNRAYSMLLEYGTGTNTEP